MAKKNVKMQETNYNGYRITRKIREQHAEEVKLPFSMNMPPAARHQIETRAILERFPMMRTLKWLVNNDVANEILSTEGLLLYPIIDDDKYSMVLEGNLNTEEVSIVVRRNQMSDKDREAFDSVCDIVVEDGEEIPDEIKIKSDQDAFVDVLKHFVENSAFIPTIVYLDTIGEEDLYYKSVIRKLVGMHLSLQFSVIKMVVDDILDADPDHMDAKKLKEDQIDAVVNMEYPPAEDVYYFITWNGETYRLHRDMNLSPRMDNASRRSYKQKSKKNGKKNKK